MWGTAGRGQALISPALLSQLRQVTLWQGILAPPAQAAATAPSLASSGTACLPPPLPPGSSTVWAQRPMTQWRSFAALPRTSGGEPRPAASTPVTVATGNKPWRKPGLHPRDSAFQPPLAGVAKADLQVIAAAASGTSPASLLFIAAANVHEPSAKHWHSAHAPSAPTPTPTCCRQSRAVGTAAGSAAAAPLHPSVQCCSGCSARQSAAAGAGAAAAGRQKRQ
jgi:hypothetical protein